MSVKKKKNLQPCVHCKANAASSLKFKSIFFKEGFFVGFSHISVSKAFVASSAFTKLTDEKGPLLDRGGKNTEKSSLSHRKKFFSINISASKEPPPSI